MSSQTATLTPIVGALVAAEEIIGKNRIWLGKSIEQTAFITDYMFKRNELSRLSTEELRTWVSFVASELNKVLAKEGFSIKLEDFGRDEFGVVAILDVLVEWLKEGETTLILAQNSNCYDAVRLEKSNFRTYWSPVHEHPLAVVYTKSGDKVCMTIADKARPGFDLLARIHEINQSHLSAFPVDHIKFPMVNLDQKVNIDWLVGMSTLTHDSRRARISQALQQTKFKMNHFGARAKSAVTVGVKIRGLQRNDDLVIDKPFYLWIMREGLSIPILTAYIDYDDWKNPGTLEM